MAALARPDPRAHQCGSCGSSRGRNGARPPKVTARQLDHARRLLADPNTTMIEVAARLKIDRSTLYRALNREKRLSDCFDRVRTRCGPSHTFITSGRRGAIWLSDDTRRKPVRRDAPGAKASYGPRFSMRLAPLNALQQVLPRRARAIPAACSKPSGALRDRLRAF